MLDTTRFPVIDVERGGSIDGEIAALNRLVDLAIPSVPIVSREEGTLVDSRARSRVRSARRRRVPRHGDHRARPRARSDRAGTTLEQVKAASPARGYTRRYGSDTGPWTTNAFHRGRLPESVRGRSHEPRRRLVAIVVLGRLLVAFAPNRASGQGRGGGTAADAEGASAPIDSPATGCRSITEDWPLRMLTPPKGDYIAVPMTPEARKIADAWDPAADHAAGNQCKAYGPRAIMRLPGRLHITWQDDTTLRVETDAGHADAAVLVRTAPGCAAAAELAGRLGRAVGAARRALRTTRLPAGP